MVRLFAAALIAFSALSASPAAAQDLIAEDAQVREIQPEFEERSYPAQDAGGAAHTGTWRVAGSFLSRSSTRHPSMSGR